MRHPMGACRRSAAAGCCRAAAGSGEAYRWCLCASTAWLCPLTGCALGFFAGWGARGMVVGMLGGKLLHAAAFAVLVATTDWENERRRATRRVGGGSELL